MGVVYERPHAAPHAADPRSEGRSKLSEAIGKALGKTWCNWGGWWLTIITPSPLFFVSVHSARVKVLCFDTVSQVRILKELREISQFGPGREQLCQKRRYGREIEKEMRERAGERSGFRGSYHYISREGVAGQVIF